jgi:hypothetical protein
MLSAWLEPIGSWLAGFDDGPQGPGAPVPVRRSALIVAELATPPLTWQPSGQVPGQAGAWPPAASAAYRWAVCYVVEGAQSGGAVLHRRLAPHPLNYLKGSPAGPGPRWHLFTEALHDQVRGSQQTGEACVVLSVRPHARIATGHHSSPKNGLICCFYVTFLYVRCKYMAHDIFPHGNIGSTFVKCRHVSLPLPLERKSHEKL